MYRRTVTVIVVLALTVLARPGLVQADETRDEQWIVKALQLEKVHKLSQGEGVTIGLIDTGVDADHPDLKGNVKAGKDYGTAEGQGIKDVKGHGTGVASLVVGHGHGDKAAAGVTGIAPKAKIISVSIGWDGKFAEIGNELYDAVDWLLEQDVDLISTSLGGTPDSNGAVNKAMKQGVPVVSAAGNITKHPVLGSLDYMAAPANDAGAIPVSGTDQAGKFWDGSVDLSDAAEQTRFGMAAPATDLIAAKKGGGYATNSGTSGSAPIVAGTLALIKSAYPDLTYESWMTRLLETADDAGDKGYDEKYGNGIVNPYRALTEETTYDGKDGSQTSSPDDRLPLEEQGKGQSQDDGNGSGSNDDALSPSSGVSSLLLPLGIVVAVVGLTAVVVIAVVFVKRRSKASSGSP